MDHFDDDVPDQEAVLALDPEVQGHLTGHGF